MALALWIVSFIFMGDLHGTISYSMYFACQVLWCSQSGNHPQEDLPKFGYTQNMKVKIQKNKK
jgi:hypothetical protein